ncbi:MAG: hypothetical protein HZA53_02925 [Planctomycetes bacterium]|nr:hypothetical protein [Planctomycetota bacterium]
MKKARRSERSENDELARSYRFDYSKAKPNRFAGAMPDDAVVVVLDPDVARVYRSSRQVNAALRATLLPRRGAKTTRKAKRKRGA